MTAIAIWCNHEVKDNPGLWIAADSRVSATDKSVLIEDAAKLFSLSVTCRSPGDDGLFSKVYYTHTLGYCFAGNTLMGQNAYLTLTPLLCNLISPASYVPSLADVARHVLAYLSLTFDDYKERVGPSAMFEVALFGFCHRTAQLSVFHYTPKLEGGIFRMTCIPYHNMKDRDFVYLGDDKSQMCSRISAGFAGATIPGRPVSRIPRHIIQDCIEDESAKTIGGDLQLGIADEYGFRPFTLCKPRVKGQPAAYLSYLGRELTPDIALVGKARVGGPGMV